MLFLKYLQSSVILYLNLQIFLPFTITGRSPAGSVISLQPSQTDSHLSDQEMSAVNPGYIPDDDEVVEKTTPTVQTDNTQQHEENNEADTGMTFGKIFRLFY